MRIITILYLLVFVITSYAGDEISDADWAKLKQQALSRRRKVIFNNDAVEVTWGWLKSDKPITQEKFNARRMNMAIGNEIDTITFAPFGVGMRTIHRSKVTDIFYEGANGLGKKTYNPTKELHDQGTDALELAVNFCRANGFEIFPSLRVNDYHDAWDRKRMPTPFKAKHPEYLIGSRSNPPSDIGAWSAYDFAHKEVRDRLVAIAKEMMDNYDVDGIELDFNRWPILLKSVAWGKKASPEETKLIAGMMKEISDAAEEIGRKHRKPRLVAINIPDSLEFCIDSGMDIPAWCKKNYVDLIIIGSDAGNFLPRGYAVKQMKKLKKPVYLSCCDPDMGRCMRNDRKNIFGRNTVAAWVGTAAAALSAKPDGLHYFNQFYVDDPKKNIQSIKRNLDDLAGMDKIYYLTPGGINMGVKNRDHYRKCSVLYPKNKKAIAVGQNAVFYMEIGDDFRKQAALKPEITLYLQTIKADDCNLQVSINGNKLKPLEKKGNIYNVSVSPAFLRKGLNQIDIKDTGYNCNLPRRMILDSNHVPHWNNPTPWSFLTYIPGSIKAKNHTCIINDQSEEHAVLAAYKLPARKNGTQKVDFKLKVKECDTPGAVACMLANGADMEIVMFNKDNIELKFAKKSVPFNTQNDFHHYVIEMVPRNIIVKADNKVVLKAPLVKRVDSPEAKEALFSKADNNDFKSLVAIGSISKKGKGVSVWKNIYYNLNGGAILADLALKVNFPKQ